MTSPIARRLIFPAADRYASINAGDIVSAPAMLSKPRVESSAGRNFVASTSSASRSRIALVYSVRLRRCRPGAGRCGVAARSSVALHPADQRLHRRRIGTAVVGRRHQTGAKLADDFLADLRMRAEVGEVHLIEQQVRGLQPRVVAGDAVLIDDRALARSVSAGNDRLALRRRWSGLRRHDSHPQNADPACDQKSCFHRCLCPAGYCSAASGRALLVSQRVQRVRARGMPSWYVSGRGPLTARSAPATRSRDVKSRLLSARGPTKVVGSVGRPARLVDLYLPAKGEIIESTTRQARARAERPTPHRQLEGSRQSTAARPRCTRGESAGVSRGRRRGRPG